MPLYDAVRTPRPRKRDPRLLACIAIALTLVLLAFFPILWAAHLQRQYRHFISGLGESVLYAKAQGSLYVRQNGRQFRARVDGQDLRITQENGYALYGKLFNMNATFSRDVPKEDSLRLDYGDGAVLELWPYHLPDGSDRSEGIFVRFVNPEGKIYTYYTDRDTFARVTQCLSPENNPAWAE